MSPWPSSWGLRSKHGPHRAGWAGIVSQPVLSFQRGFTMFLVSCVGCGGMRVGVRPCICPTVHCARCGGNPCFPGCHTPDQRRRTGYVQRIPRRQNRHTELPAYAAVPVRGTPIAGRVPYLTDAEGEADLVNVRKAVEFTSPKGGTWEAVVPAILVKIRNNSRGRREFAAFCGHKALYAVPVEEATFEVYGVPGDLERLAAHESVMEFTCIYRTAQPNGKGSGQSPKA